MDQKKLCVFLWDQWNLHIPELAVGRSKAETEKEDVLSPHFGLNMIYFTANFDNNLTT